MFIRPLSTAHLDSIDDRNLASAPHRHTHRCQVLQGLILAESLLNWRFHHSSESWADWRRTTKAGLRKRS
jgi:hypothetical protein